MRWNPLDEVRRGTEQEAADIQAFAMALCDPEGLSGGTLDEQSYAEAVIRIALRRAERITPHQLGEIEEGLHAAFQRMLSRGLLGRSEA